MASTEKIQQLLQELGPATPDIDAVVQTEEPSWAIQFSDETIIIIEPAEDPDRMVLSAELGSASDRFQLPIYETLLCYNLLWRDTGGVKIGLAGPKGELIMSTEICLDGLLLGALQEGITAFAKLAKSWISYVTSPDAQAAPPLPGMGAETLQLHA